MPEFSKRHSADIGFSPESVEAKKPSSSIDLHFERHGEKAGEELSPEGRQQLYKKGRGRPKTRPSAVAIGSEFTRAQHSAALDMAGAMQNEEVTGNESLGEIRAILDRDLRYGSKVGTDRHLGFGLKNPEYKAAVVEASKNSRLLAFMIEKSDQLAEELGDKESTTYSRAAANVAEVVRKYVHIAKRFDQLVQDPQKKYDKVLERFLGSHLSIVDSFLCKLVEKLKGPGERDKLVAVLGEGEGFKTAEGYEIKIDTLPGQEQPTVRIKYSRKNDDPEKSFILDEDVPLDVLDEIVKEGGFKEALEEAA